MHISEAYGHDPILPYQPESSCPTNGCNKVGMQCVNIAAPLTLEPTAVVGTATVSCQGSPSVTCVTDASGTCCTVTFTQQVCVSIPVNYGVTITPSEPSIACADGPSGGNGGCGCGCR